MKSVVSCRDAGIRFGSRYCGQNSPTISPFKSVSASSKEPLTNLRLWTCTHTSWKASIRHLTRKLKSFKSLKCYRYSSDKFVQNVRVHELATVIILISKRNGHYRFEGDLLTPICCKIPLLSTAISTWDLQRNDGRKVRFSGFSV